MASLSLHTLMRTFNNNTKPSSIRSSKVSIHALPLVSTYYLLYCEGTIRMKNIHCHIPVRDGLAERVEG